jgi:hypothetical protein
LDRNGAHGLRINAGGRLQNKKARHVTGFK